MPRGYGGVPASLRPVVSFLQAQAARVFGKSIIGRLAKEADRARAELPQRLQDDKPAAKRTRRPPPKTARELRDRYEKSSFGRLIADLETYSKGEDREAINQFLDAMGGFGLLIKSLMNPPGGWSARVPKELVKAINFAAQFADEPEVVDSLQRILEGQGAEVSWPKGKPKKRKPAAEPMRLARETAVSIDTGKGGKQDFPPDHPIVTGDMVETPMSSNVYAFGYDLESRSLYIRFKDRVPPGSGGGYGSGGGRPHRPGPIYRYFNVPPAVFLGMLKASSRGTFIWDVIRVRGTVSGHNFDYALVGVQGGYVPRKAQNRPEGEAYMPREILTDRGNTLKSRLGFEWVRKLGRDGKPNTGAPKTGF